MIHSPGDWYQNFLTDVLIMSKSSQIPTPSIRRVDNLVPSYLEACLLVVPSCVMAVDVIRGLIWLLFVFLLMPVIFCVVLF
jgi:hypothetical protein